MMAETGPSRTTLLRGNVNILLVVIDALRADRLSCYGNSSATSPNIDALAAGNSLFRQASSTTAWTLPSFASFLTGTYPSKHGVNLSHPNFNSAPTSLSEYAQRCGYETFLLSNTSWISEKTGFDRGCAKFWKGWQLIQDRTDPVAVRMAASGPVKLDGFRPALDEVLRGHLFKSTLNVAYVGLIKMLREQGANRTTAVAKKRIAEYKEAGTPFFGVIHYLEPHLPFAPPRSYALRFLPPSVAWKQARSVSQDAWGYIAGVQTMTPDDFRALNALYEAEIAYLDERIGELIGALADGDMLDDTLVVLTADHGENIGDHDLMDHQYCLYESLLHVPLIIRWPRALPKRQPDFDLDVPVSLVDLAPTLLPIMSAGDAEIEAEIQNMDGKPLYSRCVDDVLFAEYLEPQPSMEQLSTRYPHASLDALNRSIKSARQGRWKLIWDSHDQVELFDLSSDPQEINNLASGHPDLVKALRKEISDNLGRPLPPDRASGFDELDPLVRKRLEDLGYLG